MAKAVFAGQGRTMIEKRRYERVAFFCPLKLTVLPDGPCMTANPSTSVWAASDFSPAHPCKSVRTSPFAFN